mmetsp:Transcript_25234/g.36248  ORF Transcript_25234/g.36248 Transcript_25234/m.36248 type:complete len:151 (-) Transcript_25234:711-1163(-)
MVRHPTPLSQHRNSGRPASNSLLLPLSELLDLTLPSVDAICLQPWPKSQAYYRQGLQFDGLLSLAVNPQEEASEITTTINTTSAINTISAPLTAVPAVAASIASNGTNGSDYSYSQQAFTYKSCCCGCQTTFSTLRVSLISLHCVRYFLV